MPGTRSPGGGSRRRRRPGMPGSPGRPSMTRSCGRRAGSWTRRMPRSPTWGSMSTGAVGPGGGRTPAAGSMCRSRTGGTPAFMTCPGTRACSGRPRAAPLMTPRTGWPAPRRPGGTPCRSWPSTCAPSTWRRCAGCSRTPPLPWDLFHVVQLAVKTTGDVRRRAIRDRYGRRGKSGDPEYGIKHLLERNLENLSPDQFAKIIETLDASPEGQQIGIAWIAKEKLRDALKLRARITGSTACERQVRDRLFAFYDWCAQHDDIPELASLAATISRWEGEIVTAVITGVTNATSESLNRLAKLEARLAYGFRNPANQRRRVRIACTRGTRRPSPAATRNRTRPVTVPRPRPG